MFAPFVAVYSLEGFGAGIAAESRAQRGGNHVSHRDGASGAVVTRISGFSRNVRCDPSSAGDCGDSADHAFRHWPWRKGLGADDDLDFLRSSPNARRVRNFRRRIRSILRHPDGVPRRGLDFVLVRDGLARAFALPGRQERVAKASRPERFRTFRRQRWTLTRAPAPGTPPEPSGSRLALVGPHPSRSPLA